MPEDKKELDENLVMLSVQVPCSLRNRLKFESYKDGRSIKDVVNKALEEYLNKISE